MNRPYIAPQNRQGVVPTGRTNVRTGGTDRPAYRGFAEGVKGHRPDRWQDAVALVTSGQITVAEAAKLIGVSRQRVHRWVYGDAWRISYGSEFRAAYLKTLWEQVT
jgi:hypothetical protein